MSNYRSHRDPYQPSNNQMVKYGGNFTTSFYGAIPSKPEPEIGKEPKGINVPHNLSYLAAALQALAAVPAIRDFFESAADDFRRPSNSLTTMLQGIMTRTNNPNVAATRARMDAQDIVKKLARTDSLFSEKNGLNDSAEALDIIIDILLEEAQVSAYGSMKRNTGTQRHRFSRFSEALTRSRANVEAMRYRVKMEEERVAEKISPTAIEPKKATPIERTSKIYVRRFDSSEQADDEEDDGDMDSGDEMDMDHEVRSTMRTQEQVNNLYPPKDTALMGTERAVPRSLKDLVQGTTVLSLRSSDSGARYSTAAQPFVVLDLPPLVKNESGLGSVTEMLASLTRARDFNGQGQEWCRLSRYWFNLPVHQGEIRVMVDLPPPVLFIKIGRVQHTGRGNEYVKFNAHAEFETELDLKPFTMTPLPVEKESLKYDLKAVIVHCGASHDEQATFETYVRGEKTHWYRTKCNTVEAVPKETVLAKEAYVLVYQRMDGYNIDYLRSYSHAPSKTRFAEM